MKKLLLSLLIASTALADGPTDTASSSTTPSLTASSAYTAADQVGGKLSFPLPRTDLLSGYVLGVTIADKAGDTRDLTGTLFLFDADPTNTSFANKAALTLNDSDLGKIFAIIPVAAANCANFAASGACHVGEISKAFRLNSRSPMLYGVFLTDSTPTFASTSDITFSLHISFIK
jgi:hypothetical protein